MRIESVTAKSSFHHALFAGDNILDAETVVARGVIGPFSVPVPTIRDILNVFSTLAAGRAGSQGGGYHPGPTFCSP